MAESNYDYFERMYGGRLGNDQPGDGYKYRGRGFIQATGKSTYAAYGPKIAALWNTSPDQPDFDLVGDPDRALDPDISAAVSAIYFRDHGGDGQARIPQAASLGNWGEVRRLVQGGSAGLEDLTRMATELWALPMPEQPPVFDRAAILEGLRAALAAHEAYDREMREMLDRLLAMAEAA